MRIASLAALALLAVATSTEAAPNPDLEKARKAVDEFQYPAAAKALDAAWLAPGNDRATVLEILRLQAVVAATVGQTEAARAYFRNLLYYAPDYELADADLGPKITSLYYEAKGRVTVDNVLRVEPAAPQSADGKVQSVGVMVKADPLKAVKKVRFHLKPAGGAEATSEAVTADAPRDGTGIRATVAAASVQWWAELLGEKDRCVALIGSAAKPLVEAATLAPPPPPPVLVEAPAATSGASLRPVAYGLGGAGVVAAAAGAYFGLQSSAARAQLASAQKNADGAIVGLTRQQGLELDAKVKSNATLANGLFVAGAVLAGAGVTLFVLSNGTTVSAAPGGVAVKGNLP